MAQISNKKDETTNPTSILKTTKIAKGLGRIQDSIRNFWNGLLKPKKECPVETILRGARNALVILTIIAMLIMAVIVYCKDNPIPHLLWIAEVCFIYLILHQWLYINAIRTSKEERRNFKKNFWSTGKVIMRAAIILLAISTIISQNVFGIGTVVEAALPWTKPAAEAVLEFTNGTVEEFIKFFR